MIFFLYKQEQKEYTNIQTSYRLKIFVGNNICRETLLTRHNHGLFRILSWCWWNFLTSANQIAQIGSCDRSRIHVPDLGGMGVWPRKNGFHKTYKNLDNIAVYLIASLKSKWKNKQMKNMNNWIWKLFFIHVLEGNLHWNSWIFKMFNYLKGSIVKFKLNFEKALEKMQISMMMTNIK